MKQHSKHVIGLAKEQLEKSEDRAYEKPILVAYGDVRDVTLGATQGSIELGSGCTSGFTNGDPFEPC